MRALLIANAKAKTVTRRTRDLVSGILARRFRLEQVVTTHRGHATEVARDAADGGTDLVVALGGDGTVNEIANGIRGTDMPLGILPGGGANVFARSIGIPRDPASAAALLLQRSGGTPLRLPLGTVGGRSFAANCGVGFDAAVVREVDRHPARKRRFGDAYYIWTGTKVFFTGFDRLLPHVELRTPDGRRLSRQFLAIVQNTDPYTYLGRRAMRLCPQARPGAGLHAFSLSSMTTPIVLRILASAFGRANHALFPHVTVTRDVENLVIRSDRPLPVQADGEYLGEHREVEVGAEPAALAVVR